VADLSGVEPLTSAHSTHDFDCGKPELNDFLRQHALANEGGGGARTYVVHRGEKIVGYYSLAAASVRPEDAAERVLKGQGGYDVPVILLARLAVDLSEQNGGLGSALLKDALVRVLGVADEIGSARCLYTRGTKRQGASTGASASSRHRPTAFTYCF
jgi:GNAT superfamily N-acetyltransferase